ncbi:MAG: hypothetical protein ACXWG1_17960 [Usitatibacter sp.]
MASELRRMARALVEERGASFATALPKEEAEARVAAALAPIVPRRLRFERRWAQGPGGTVLEVWFHPSPRASRMLEAASLGLVALVAAASWAIASDQVERGAAFIAALSVALGMLALPLAIAAFGAQREAEEARISRALTRALRDEGEPGGDRSP